MNFANTLIQTFFLGVKTNLNSKDSNTGPQSQSKDRAGNKADTYINTQTRRSFYTSETKQWELNRRNQINFLDPFFAPG